MSKHKRNVKKNRSSNTGSLASSSYSRAKKAKIRSRERMQKIALSQAKRYLIYALAAYLASELVKFLIYSVFFRGGSTPGGIIFLLVIYLQIGLLIMTFVFFVLAVYKTLKRLLTEEF